MKKANTWYELSGRECGQGWNDIIQPLYGELLRLGGTVRQIKEKFGGLRFYYRLPSRISSAKKHSFAQKVRQAEETSLSICERCGKPGELANDQGYLFTACKSCRDARRELNRRLM
jgi:hypothetical protein